MLDRLCLIASKNSLSIEEKTGYINLLLDINNGFVILPSLNLNSMNEYINECLDLLTPREEKILRLMYGLDNHKLYTVDKVSKDFNISKDKVVQIKEKAIRKLKFPGRIDKLKNTVFINENSIYNGDSDYSIYKTYITELFDADVDNYNQNNDFQTLYFKKVLEKRANKKSIERNVSDINIEEMEFSVRTLNCLKRSDINTVSDILKHDLEQLNNIRNLGKKCAKEVLQKIFVFISTNYNFDDFDLDYYPLMHLICKVELEYNEEINIDNLLKDRHGDYRHISIDSLFDANMSPGLINILLMHGFVNFREVILKSNEIISALENYSKNYVDEFQSILEKYTDVSVIVDLDLQLLNFISTYNVSDFQELIDYSCKIENQNTKDEVEKIIQTIREYDYSIIKEYRFNTPFEEVPVNEVSDDEIDIDLIDFDEIFD